MITKDKKKEILKDLVDRLSRQKTIVFFNYNGLKVDQFQELRTKLREEGVDCYVVKKTLIDLALEKSGLKVNKIKKIPGQIALVLGYEDEVTPARILYQFAKENEDLKIVAGVVQGDYLENEAVISLAKLPSRQELLGKLVGTISGPTYGLVNALKGNLRKLVFVLSNIKLEV
ncbi:50S ribosomal protein L10 [Patescibacteria group bacterium]|nr:50S ribosomal protein L10 [Patescibacteria group bacterium]MBU1563890.1 50S ribosomal protein L10 [Patescibacteria group bacterium]